MTVPDEAVEAAAMVLWYAEKYADWGKVPQCRKEPFLNEARAALEAAAPFIAAQALEDAAEELTGKRLLNKPFHEYYPEWLRRKADTYRSKS